MQRKKLFLILSLALSLSFTQRSYAIGGIGDIVFDPAAFGKQTLQLANEIITKGATLATQINTYVAANKIWMEPLANQMIATSLLAQQKGTINLVTGGLGGQSLLQSNPDQWVQNQGLNALRVSLGDVSTSKGTYNSSILNSLVGTYRGSTDTKTKIQANTVSSRPGLIQKDICKDAALTAAATNDVQIMGKASDPAAIKARKTELYNTLCVGNPQTDTALANRLMKVESSRPDLISTKSFEAYLAGDNAYVRSVKTSLIVSQEKQAKEQTAKEDLNRGGGIVSPSTCTETAGTNESADLGNIANLPCRMNEFTGSSAQLSNAYQQALNAPIQKLIASNGTGILGSLSALLSAKNTWDQMKNAFGLVKATGALNNTSVTSSSAVKTPDLANNAAARENLTKPIDNRIKKYDDAISALEQKDVLLRSHLDLGDSYLESLRSCYQGIVDTYKIPASDPRVAPGFAYYTAHALETASLRADISIDTIAIQQARGALSSLRNILANSNSSEEINTAYEDFESKSSDGTYPNEMSAVKREGDIQTVKTNNDLATMDDSELVKLRNECPRISAQLQAERDAATQSSQNVGAGG